MYLKVDMKLSLHSEYISARCDGRIYRMSHMNTTVIGRNRSQKGVKTEPKMRTKWSTKKCRAAILQVGVQNRNVVCMKPFHKRINLCDMEHIRVQKSSHISPVK